MSNGNGSTIAIDLGGTVVKLGLVRGGQVVAGGAIDGHSERGLAQVLPRLRDTMLAIRANDTHAVGLALPTLVDSRTTRVLAPMKGKYDGIDHFDLPAWCRAEFDLPLKLENDAHAALLGEWRFGAARDCIDAVAITLGTGIGTSAVLRGKALRGAHGLAGNMGGHLVVEPQGYPCVCGGRGCVEAQQHLHAVRDIARRDPRFASSALHSLGDFRYGDLFQHRTTDALAHDLVARSLDLWGALVVSMIHSFDPARVVVSGGIMRSREVILPHLQSFADRALTPGGRVQVVAAQLGDDAALLGVASLFTHPPEYL